MKNLSYEKFKDVTVAAIKEAVADIGFEVYVGKFNKVNRSLDGITIVSPGTNVSPTLYINDIYEEYISTGDIKSALDKAVKKLGAAVVAIPDSVKNEADNIVAGLKNPEKFCENIVFQLINTEQNAELLENIPSRKFFDLSVIYRYIGDAESDEFMSVVITNSLMEHIGLSEDDLYKRAWVNTPKLLPLSVKSMRETMIDLIAKEGMTLDIIEDMLPEDDPMGMTVISNNKSINGAVYMMYTEYLGEIADKLGTDLYILPSSIHEVIAMKCINLSADELVEQVTDINNSEVKLEDRLSNQVYFFNRDKKSLSLVSNTRIDIDTCRKGE